MKIKGIKKAVGDYKRANAEGRYSPRYGYLMLDRATGELWTDEFYSLGHNEWKQYHDESVVNLITWAHSEGLFDDELVVNMENAKAWAEKACAEWIAE